MTAFNVGDVVSYTSRGEWRTGTVEASRQELAVDRDGNESIRLMVGIADAFAGDMRRLAWRDIRQCAAMIAGEHVERFAGRARVCVGPRAALPLARPG